MLYKFFRNCLFIIVLIYIIFSTIQTIIVAVHKDQICTIANPTGEISKGYVSILKDIQPYHNSTWIDKNIIQPGIRFEVWRNSLGIKWTFFIGC